MPQEWICEALVVSKKRQYEKKKPLQIKHSMYLWSTISFLRMILAESAFKKKTCIIYSDEN